MEQKIIDIVTRPCDSRGVLEHKHDEMIYLIREYIKDVKGVDAPEFKAGNGMMEAHLFSIAFNSAMVHFAGKINGGS